MTGEELPRATVRRRHPWLQLMWVVPLVAAGLAAWLVYQRVQQRGPELTVEFRDAGGVRAGQTPVKYRGVQVGVVTGMALSEDRDHVLVKVRLDRAAASLAAEGTQFWVVRPQVGWGNITGLGTVISGPEIHAQPAPGPAGERRVAFRGLEQPPLPPGIRVVLKGERPVSLRPGSPVHFRGVEVGTVNRVRLSADSRAAEVELTVYQRYAPLVRTGSAFWNVSGVSVTGGLMRGVELQLESVRTLVTGGIEFASPENSPRAKSGTVFFLHESPRKEWLSWNARIPIAKESTP